MGPGFESLRVYKNGLHFALLAQLVEQLTLNQWGPGLNPRGCTKGVTSVIPFYKPVIIKRYSSRAAALKIQMSVQPLMTAQGKSVILYFYNSLLLKTPISKSFNSITFSVSVT